MGLQSSTSRPVIEQLVAQSIATGELVESALEFALIGFEEASDKRVYLFNLSEVDADALSKSLASRVGSQIGHRKFSGDSVKPMTPVYAQFVGSDVRVKWTEEHTEIKLDDMGEPVRKPQKKNIVLVADLAQKTAELRLDPPENYTPHQKMAWENSRGCLLRRVSREGARRTRVRNDSSSDRPCNPESR